MSKLNEDKYIGDTRYEKVLEQMQLLGIEDVTTDRQSDNGTVVWRLPIKNEWGGKLIEVASFKTGYVRNQNSGYSNYQLNKRCEGEPEYFELPNGDYRKFTTRSCVLIPIEIDRLEYLISYCLKTYFIKRANQVADGEFIPKWEHQLLLDSDNLTQDKYNEAYNNGYADGRDNKEAEEVADEINSVKVIVNGHRYNVL